jgi:hypothetical protein
MFSGGRERREVREEARVVVEVVVVSFAKTPLRAAQRPEAMLRRSQRGWERRWDRDWDRGFEGGGMLVRAATDGHCDGDMVRVRGW